MYVLGIDGGGTKTVGLVADENADVFMKVITGMFHSIKTCHQELFDKDESTIVVLSGGVFTNSKLFIQHFQKLASISLANLTFQKNISRQ